jgi:ATP-dependent Clp protease ATP-binding subunit ClpC
MFQLFDRAARRVVILASEESRKFNHQTMETRHLLMGLLRQGHGIAASALTDLGIGYDAVLARVVDAVGRGTQPTPSHVPFTEDLKRAMELSLAESLELHHDHVGTEHILLGLIREENDATRLLAELGATTQEVRERVHSRLSSTG